MLRFLTAGESHGPSLTTILDGMPAGLSITPDIINKELARRQKGYGSGGRMKIETDTVQILGGVMAGKTTGAPIALLVQNAHLNTILVIVQTHKNGYFRHRSLLLEIPGFCRQQKQ